MSEATTLSLASALLTTIGGAFFFRERVRVTTAVALFLGFAGVYLILEPAFRTLSWQVFLPLLSATCFSASTLTVKRMSVTASMPVCLVYILAGMSVLSLPFAWYQWTPIAAHEWVWICLLAVLYIVINWSIIKAYSYASAGFLAPFKFIRFPLLVTLNYLFFPDIIAIHVLYGGVLIISGCLLIHSARFDPSYLLQMRLKAQN